METNKILKKLILPAIFIFFVSTAFIFINRDDFSFTPWNSSGVMENILSANGNRSRIAIIENAQTSIIVIDYDGNLKYKLNLKQNSNVSFSSPQLITLDDDNNIYILDNIIGGAFGENTERIIKYSDTGRYLGEVYSCKYINEDFIYSKGKVAGFTYHNGYIYIVRLENNGFYLESVPAAGGEDVRIVNFVDYPNALRDLMYFNINISTKLLSFSTKSGYIKLFDFSGIELGVWQIPLGGAAISTTVDQTGLLYSDIINNKIVKIDTETNEHSVLLADPESPLYMYLAYSDKKIFAASPDNVLILTDDGITKNKIIDSYSYSKSYIQFSIFLFCIFILDSFILMFLIFCFIFFISKIRISSTLKNVLSTGIFIVLGAAFSSVLLIKATTAMYNQEVFADLENVSRILASSIDTDVLKNLSSPIDWASSGYLEMNETLRKGFVPLRFKDELVYQTIWKIFDDTVYIVYDIANGSPLSPYDVYTEDSYYKEVIDTGEYVHFGTVNSVGSWLFACGPIKDKDGTIVALIETGYDAKRIATQMRNMTIQIMLAVTAAAIAFFFVVLEFILISTAYKKNKIEVKENKNHVFHPELFRAVLFVLFMVGNLTTAILPMYSVNLYKPFLNLPKELIITLPFMAETIFAALALLVIPKILPRLGLARIGFLSAILTVAANVLCFVAQNTVYLAFAYTLVGFSTGSLILVVNTIIGAQENTEAVNRGFANFNASYLSGVNVGIVFGSILSQFISYRFIYLFAVVFSLAMLLIIVFSIRSPFTKYLYIVEYVKEKKGEEIEGNKSILKFVCNIFVICTLLLALFPYTISMCFTSYFVPIFGIEHGLTESNIGQLLLLSGLFAILFGTSLCNYAAKKLQYKMIVIASLLLCYTSFYVLSLHTTVPVLILAVLLLAVSNIFSGTNIQTFYSILYQFYEVSPLRALSVYSAMENIALAIGPVIFSYILAFDIGVGLKILSLVSFISLAMFIIISGTFSLKQKRAAALQ